MPSIDKEAIPANTFNRTHYPFVLIATLSFVVGGIFFPELLDKIELPVFALLVILIGIPHGATDHLMTKSNMGSRYNFLRFSAIYLAVAAAYGLLWYLFPVASLALFLSIAAFHFGQSQLLYVRRSHTDILKNIGFIMWGSYLFMSILFFNWQSTWFIIDELFDQAIPATFIEQIRVPSIITLFILNVAILGYFLYQKQLTKREFSGEIINLIIWPLLAIYTPLLLAFGIYFGLWHSFISVKLEQKGFWEGDGKHLKIKKFFVYSIPLTISTIAIYFLLSWINSTYEIYESYYLLLFVLIAVLTLPHIMVIQRFYLDKLSWKPY